MGIGAGTIVYLQYRNISEGIIHAIDSRTGEKLGREVRFRKVGFSPLKGVVIDGACISRRPDFSRGAFFCADRVEIRPEISRLMKERLRFTEVTLVNPMISIREQGGKWDFEDLLELLPKTAQGLHVTWNTRNLMLTGARLEADISSSGRSFALENADITVRHDSEAAGNFGLELKGDLKSTLNGRLLTSMVSAKTDINFNYAGMTSARGEAELTDAALGAITLDRTNLGWELFNMDKPAAKANYDAHLTAEGLWIPEQSCGAAAAVNTAMKTLSSVIGKEAPKVSDIKLESLAVELALKNGTLQMRRFSMDTNFVDVGAEYELNGPARSVAIRFGTRIGNNRLDLTAKGPMNAPHILPTVSATLNRKLTEAIRAMNSFIIGIFPITGDVYA